LLAAPELEANVHLIVFSPAAAEWKVPLKISSVKAPTKIKENMPHFKDFILTSFEIN